jgi:Zn-dependent protease with chaperone function
MNAETNPRNPPRQKAANSTKKKESEQTMQTVEVKRWPSERPLFILVLLSSLFIWVSLAISIVGLVYAALIFIFLFISHLAFITHLRGSAIRLGPDQMPELHERVLELSRRVGLKKAPVAYVMQAGGMLNALATKLFSSNFIVLYSDLLEACGDNTEARDMIIAHELGHLKSGHLRGIWFIMPGLFVPFLGSAYSRAREYTSDRFGFSICQDRQSALIGLAILAAGGKLGPTVNLRSLANQGKELNTTWMTIGRWLATHPPLADRLAAIEPELAEGPRSRMRGRIGAFAILGCIVFIPVGLGLTIGPMVKNAVQKFKNAQASVTSETESADTMTSVEIQAATEKAWRDMALLSQTIENYRAKTGSLPVDQNGAYAAWTLLHPADEYPLDPFDGYGYGYELVDGSYAIWSEGPSSDTNEDNLTFRPTET